MESQFKKCNYQALVNLNCTIKNRIAENKRREVEYEECLEEAFLIEDLVNNVGNKKWLVESKLNKVRKGRLGEL